MEDCQYSDFADLTGPAPQEGEARLRFERLRSGPEGLTVAEAMWKVPLLRLRALTGRL